ncbi:hypothetical protein C4568_00100 [Candidatus Parcubacteria bacterium]|nr:MAG: hypothetical protein C4568_00100 [Candidatus Parcubacteria bacterium]
MDRRRDGPVRLGGIVLRAALDRSFGLEAAPELRFGKAALFFKETGVYLSAVKSYGQFLAAVRGLGLA